MLSKLVSNLATIQRPIRDTNVLDRLVLAFDVWYVFLTNNDLFRVENIAQFTPECPAHRSRHNQYRPR